MKQGQHHDSADARSIVASLYSVRIVQHFNAPAARVFDAWLDADSAGQWLFATALRPMIDVEIDARVGGAFRLSAEQENAFAHTGRYIEIVPPRRLVFTLQMAECPRSMTLVTVSITPRSAGCELMLSHAGLPLDRASYAEGRWTGILHGLGIVLDATRARATIRNPTNIVTTAR